VAAPHAGRTATIADHHQGQSLVETLPAGGIGHVAPTDWKPATPDMKDLEIDAHLDREREAARCREGAEGGDALLRHPEAIQFTDIPWRSRPAPTAAHRPDAMLAAGTSGRGHAATKARERAR
jgi:hypothetical protein